MTSTSTSAFPLATEDPYTGGQDTGPGTANSGSDSGDGSVAGASGSSPGGFQLSHGAIIAIIVVVVGVAIIGSRFPPRHGSIVVMI